MDQAANDGTDPPPAQPRLRGVRGLDLPNEFEITIPDADPPGAPWSAVNGLVGISVYPTPGGGPTSLMELADGRRAHMVKSNQIKAAMTENAYKEQWLLSELNGVFVHVRHDHLTGKVAIVVADKRLI